MVYFPLSPWAETILLIVRIILALVMLYFGSFKIRNPVKYYHEFAQMGFKPGWLFTVLAIIIEFFGGILILLGIWIWLPASLFAIQMIIGSAYKKFKAQKGFQDYSYDLILLSLCLVLLAFGPGILSFT